MKNKAALIFIGFQLISRIECSEDDIIFPSCDTRRQINQAIVRNFTCETRDLFNINCKFERSTQLESNETLFVHMCGKPQHGFIGPFPGNAVNGESYKWSLNSEIFTQLIFIIQTSSFAQNVSISNIFNILKLSQPANLTVEGFAHRIVLQWSPPEEFVRREKNSFNYIEYELQYSNSMGNSRKISGLRFNESRIRFELNDVTPCDAYNIQVRCRIKKNNGISSWSEWTKCYTITNKSSPRESPKLMNSSFEINEKNNSFRDITLYWRPLDRKYRYCQPYRYEIIRQSQQNTAVVELSADSFTTTFKELENEIDYRFVMQSVNAVGKSNDSLPMIVRRQRDLPKHANIVSIKQEKELNTYNVTWKSLDENAIRYTIFWCKRSKSGHCASPLNMQTEWKQNWLDIKINDSTQIYKFGISTETDNSSTGILWITRKANQMMQNKGFSVLQIYITILVSITITSVFFIVFNIGLTLKKRKIDKFKDWDKIPVVIDVGVLNSNDSLTKYDAISDDSRSNTTSVNDNVEQKNSNASSGISDSGIVIVGLNKNESRVNNSVFVNSKISGYVVRQSTESHSVT